MGGIPYFLTAKSPLVNSIYSSGPGGSPSNLPFFTASGNFEISLTSGSDFGSSLTITPSEGSVPETSIFVHSTRVTEEILFSKSTHSSFALTEDSIAQYFLHAGISVSSSYLHIYTRTQILRAHLIDRWFDSDTRAENYGSVMKNILGGKEFSAAADTLKKILEDTEVEWKSAVLFISGVKNEVK